MKILLKRGEIAPGEQFLLFSTIFCCLLVDLCVKTGIRFSLRDKRLFEISEFEITRVDCICFFQVLILKKCPVSDITLSLMAENCRYIRGLTIESVEDVTKNILSDVGISEMGQNLRYLQKLDISWNLCM